MVLECQLVRCRRALYVRSNSFTGNLKQMPESDMSMNGCWDEPKDDILVLTDARDSMTRRQIVALYMKPFRLPGTRSMLSFYVHIIGKRE